MSLLQRQGAMVLFEIKGVSKDFGGLRALSNVDFHAHQSEICGLIGPNGSGKTTLFNVITGFLRPTAGQLTFKGESITGLKPHEIAKRGLMRIFQHSSLFPSVTVMENIINGAYTKTSSSIWGSFFDTRSYKEERRWLKEKAMEALAFVGLEERANVIAGNLPYGEQRIVELATTLMGEPELLLLDEPATGMNAEEIAEVMDLMCSIQQKGVSIIVVEHHMRLITGICTRIVVLNAGVKIAEGTPKEITENDDVISAYLGRKRDNA